MLSSVCKNSVFRRSRQWFVNAPPLSRSLWTKFKTNFGVYETVFAGNVSEPNTVPEYVTMPSYAKTGIVNEPDHYSDAEIQDRGQIEMIGHSCRFAKFVLDSTASLLTPGTTTDEIDSFVHDVIISNNAYPSPLNYKGFQKSVCTSINNVLCHGVPDDRPLVDGDLISVDVSVFMNGFHGDCAATYCVGNVDKMGKTLISVAEQCMYRGIEACGPGKHFSDIGKAIELYAVQNGHSVVSCITGHGIGTYFHGPPIIFHSSLHHYPGKMQPGMVFTVEPVICQGSSEIEMLDDGWSVVTADDSRGAQFEHTILITENGYNILTE